MFSHDAVSIAHGLAETQSPFPFDFVTSAVSVDVVCVSTVRMAAVTVLSKAPLAEVMEGVFRVSLGFCEREWKGGVLGSFNKKREILVVWVVIHLYLIFSAIRLLRIISKQCYPC